MTAIIELVVVYKIPYRRARAWPSASREQRPSASREQRYLAYKVSGYSKHFQGPKSIYFQVIVKKLFSHIAIRAIITIQHLRF